MDPLFNLADEKWIKVLYKDCTIREVSSVEALLDAQNIICLAGESITQDLAVLRYLVALLYSIYEKVDINGNPSMIDSIDSALDRWKYIWECGRFLEKPICEYFKKYRNRFYLIHPEYPFYQVPEKGLGTRYGACKLNGKISESNNKKRWFSQRAGEEKKTLSLKETARWLIWINAWDDSSVKIIKTFNGETKDKWPSSGVGWLGKVGPVYANGRTLFETLMFNLVFLQDGEKLWPRNVPSWELDEPHKGQRVEIPVPDNPAALYTMQSRHISLIIEGDRVTGFNSYAGDFCQTQNAFTEQMTAWKKEVDDKGNETGNYIPLHNIQDRQLWRDFSGIVVGREGAKVPGVVRWIERLQDEGILDDDTPISLRTVGVKYDGRYNSITDEFGDSLSFSSFLVSEKGAEWAELVKKEVEICKELGQYLRQFERDIRIASGRERPKASSTDSKMESDAKSYAEERFNYGIDIQFRKWIKSINKSQGPEERDKKRKEWEQVAISTAERIAMEFAEDAGDSAYMGREIKITDGKGNVVDKKIYDTSRALEHFHAKINRLKRGEINGN